MSCDGTCSGGDITGRCMLGLNEYWSGVYCGKYMLFAFRGHKSAGCPKWQNVYGQRQQYQVLAVAPDEKVSEQQPCAAKMRADLINSKN